MSQQLSDRASQPKTPAKRPPNVAETWSQDDMAIIMHNLTKMMDKQNAREYKRAKKEEKRERTRSAKRKSRKEDSDDEQSVDIIGALAQFDLHVNVSRLPATKEPSRTVPYPLWEGDWTNGLYRAPNFRPNGQRH